MKQFKNEYPINNETNPSTCRGEGCRSPYIQNKKYQLCGDCMYKKNHGGRSRMEVQREKAKNGQSVSSRFYTKTPNTTLQTDKGNSNPGQSKLSPPRPRIGIKPVSIKQAIIDRKYRIMIADMDINEEKICAGCGRFEGGDVRLSHSHIISRADCKRFGFIDLISDNNNVTYHCIDFGENEGCHRKWENPKQRHRLLDYHKNMEYIKTISSDIYAKYLHSEI